jgi:hypothetical protein
LTHQLKQALNPKIVALAFAAVISATTAARAYSQKTDPALAHAKWLIEHGVKIEICGSPMLCGHRHEPPQLCYDTKTTMLDTEVGYEKMNGERD